MLSVWLTTTTTPVDVGTSAEATSTEWQPQQDHALCSPPPSPPIDPCLSLIIVKQ